MKVSEAVGRALAQWGVDQVFGVAGSGNFEVTTALVAGGARYVAARHEGGATTMADGYARRVPLAGRGQRAPGPRTHQRDDRHRRGGQGAHSPARHRGRDAGDDEDIELLDRPGRCRRALGAVAFRLESAETALADAARAVVTARTGRTVVLGLPLDVQVAEIDWPGSAPDLPEPPTPPRHRPTRSPSWPAARRASRPVIVAGRGALGARQELERLAAASGALLATTAMAKGLFNNSSWTLDVMGGFATGPMAKLIQEADLIVSFGASLNRWTTRNSELVGSDPDRAGRHRPRGFRTAPARDRHRDRRCRPRGERRRRGARDRIRAPAATAPSRPPQLSPPGAAGATNRSSRPTPTRASTRAPSPSRWTTCCPPSAS